MEVLAIDRAIEHACGFHHGPRRQFGNAGGRNAGNGTMSRHPVKDRYVPITHNGQETL